MNLNLEIELSSYGINYEYSNGNLRSKDNIINDIISVNKLGLISNIKKNELIEMMNKDF
jgi:hypothetical protein